MGEIMLDTKSFSLKIEEISNNLNVSYMDAIVWYCEKYDMEVETAAKLINTKIKETIALEAGKLNMMKEKINCLPV
jgi:hypothetical protein